MQVNIRNQAAGIMSHLCTCPKHGYTQGSGRMGGTSKEAIVVDGVDWLIGAGDYDCSGSIISVWDLILNRYFGLETQNCTYTGNMRQGFVGTGLFEWHPMSDGFIAQPGDIYLNEKQHTAMCITAVPDVLGEFYINEFGGITGGQTGDQTGNESRLHAYYDFPWDGILHYTGAETIETEEDDMTPSDFWNYGLGTNATSDYNNEEAWKHLSWAHHDTAALYADLCDKDMAAVEVETGEHVNTGVSVAQRVAYMEAYIKRIERKLDEIAAKMV